jgi:hypothetical protein
MPELEPDDFIITDERQRALLEALLGKWSSPAVARLLQIVSRRIADRAAKQTQATKRHFTTKEAYIELLDRAGDIFIERLGAAINDALCQAIDDLADASADTAIEELPKPKRKRNRRGTVQHKHIMVLLKSVAYVQAILDIEEAMLSKRFVALLYYQQCDSTDSGAVVEAWQNYCNLSDEQRDSRLRAYHKLLRDKGFDFDDIAAFAGRLHAAGAEGTNTIPVSQGEISAASVYPRR